MVQYCIRALNYRFQYLKRMQNFPYLLSASIRLKCLKHEFKEVISLNDLILVKIVES